MSTKDISADYDRWARSGSVFGAQTGCAGDRLALSSGRVDGARLELHEHVEREAATHSIPYEVALDRVLEQARVGVVALSQQAMKSAGITPITRPGRGGVRHNPHTGEVIHTLAGARTSERLGEPAVLSDQRDIDRWRDTLAACQARRPGATVDDRVAETKALVARAGGRWTGD